MPAAIDVESCQPEQFARSVGRGLGLSIILLGLAVTSLSAAIAYGDGRWAMLTGEDEGVFNPELRRALDRGLAQRAGSRFLLALDVAGVALDVQADTGRAPEIVMDVPRYGTQFPYQEVVLPESWAGARRYRGALAPFASAGIPSSREVQEIMVVSASPGDVRDAVMQSYGVANTLPVLRLTDQGAWVSLGPVDVGGCRAAMRAIPAASSDRVRLSVTMGRTMPTLDMTPPPGSAWVQPIGDVEAASRTICPDHADAAWRGIVHAAVASPGGDPDGLAGEISARRSTR